MLALWPNGKSTPGDVWHEFGPREPIWTPNGWTSSFHEGIDIGAWEGDDSTWLLAPVAGTVTHAGYDSIFGNRVEVSATRGGVDVMFRLCHGRTGSMQVSAGQRVSQKQRLQLMGETGKASGVHVHFEIHVNGEPIDPRDFYRSGAAAGDSSATRIIIPEEDDMKLLFITDSVDGNGVPGWALLNTRTGKLVTMRNSDPKNQERANSWARVWGNAKSCKRQDMLNAIAAIQQTA